MHRFYFNECLPPNRDPHRFLELFSAAIKEFKQLTQKHTTAQPIIVTEKLPGDMIVCGEHSLLAMIQKMENKDLRTIAFQFFDKSYPIGSFFNEDDDLVNDILHKSYHLTLETAPVDATNLALVAQNNGFLFSVPLVSSLAVHEIQLFSQTSDATLSVPNFYGAVVNTTFIGTEIQRRAALSLSILDQLRQVLGSNPQFDHTFEKEFASLSLNEQESIVTHVERAKARLMITPFATDGQSIKDVTPQNGKIKVSELRVFFPTALRIYFHEGAGKIFIASVKHKSNADQNSDIKKAEHILRRITLIP